MADPRNWKHFERLVAAIHRLSDKGAEVRWNDTIDGRQFDITIRFKRGLYEYLTVIECKDYSRPVPVSDVEAFVTKSENAGAHRAIMASSSGFQDGARRVAEKHGITLVRVSESEEIDFSILGAERGELATVVHFETITLAYNDGDQAKVPGDRSAMMYYVNQILIQHESHRLPLHHFLDQLGPRVLEGRHGVYCDHTISLPGALVVAPDDGEIPLRPISEIRVRAGVTTAQTIHGPVMFDPGLLVPGVRFENLTTGETHEFSAYELPLGADTVLEEGKFYENPRLKFYYYCDRIEDGIVTWYLVESYQLGQLLQAEFTQRIEHADWCVEVSDSATLKRLEGRLMKMKSS